MRVKKLIQHFDAHSESVNKISFHPSGNFLVSASDDSKLKVWDLRYWKLGFTLFGHSSAATSVNFSPKGDYFASGGEDTVVLVWKSNFGRTSGEFVKELASPNQTQVIEKPKSIDLTRNPTIMKAQKLLIVSPGSGQESSVAFSPKRSRRASQSFMPANKSIVRERQGSVAAKSFDTRAILEDMSPIPQKGVPVIFFLYSPKLIEY